MLASAGRLMVYGKITPYWWDGLDISGYDDLLDYDLT